MSHQEDLSDPYDGRHRNVIDLSISVLNSHLVFGFPTHPSGRNLA